MGITKKNASKIYSYIREVSIIIIGVAITLYASQIVKSCQDKKDLKLQLNAMYYELEDNLNRLNEIIIYYDDLNSLKPYLTEIYNNPENIDLEKHDHYRYIIAYAAPFSYKKNAYSMFVNSGVMKLLTDRELLMDISECYSLLEITQDEHDKFTDMKINKLMKVYDTDTKKIMMNDGVDILDPEYNYLLNFHLFTHTGFEAMDARDKIMILLERMGYNIRQKTK